MLTPLLAHLGGIDEVGIFLIPALLAIYALRRAEKTAKKKAAETDQRPDQAIP